MRPMTLADVEALLCLAAEISNHRRFVVVGSLMAIGAMVHPPAEMVRSRVLDFCPQLDPKRSVKTIARQLGQGSSFHRINGFYANPIAPALLALPKGQQIRLACLLASITVSQAVHSVNSAFRRKAYGRRIASLA